MQLSVVVMGHPKYAQASRSALLFCLAAVKQGHVIKQVFFMHDACWQAVSGETEGDVLTRQWSQLAKNNDIELDLCVSAADKRELVQSNMAEGFQARGLGQLVDVAIAVDRTVTFR
ncbi:MAG: DsrE/DsrF/TusD sulfur relay family protein [Arenicella sp.]